MRFLSFCLALLGLTLLAPTSGLAQSKQSLLSDGKSRANVAQRAAPAFGRAVAVAEGAVFISEPDNVLNPGAVYVYEQDGDGWGLVQKLRDPDAAPGDGFGRALAYCDDRLFVSTGPTPALDERVGVYEWDGSSFERVALITPSDPRRGNGYGSQMSCDGTQLAIVAGETEQVFVFDSNGGETWTETAVFTTPEAGSRFGRSIALKGDRLLVGAPLFAGRIGEAYLYTRTDGAWGEPVALHPAPTGSADLFGQSVALLGDEAIVGAVSKQARGGFGEAYVFDLSDEAYKSITLAGLLPGSSRQAYFGYAVAMSGDGIVVGAPLNEGGGGAYVFERVDGSWTFNSELVGSRSVDGDLMGYGVAVTGSNSALVTDIASEFGTGSAYLFDYDQAAESWAEVARFAGDGDEVEAMVGEATACTDGTAGAFGCANIDLLSFLPLSDLGGARGVRVNDIWGWVDPETGREYAIVCREDGTAFVDVTDPLNPVYLGNLPTHTVPSNWRDAKTVGNYAVIVSEAPGHGIQIFDMRRLTTLADVPAEFEADAHYPGIGSAHNIVALDEAGLALAVGSAGGSQGCGPGLHMVDLTDPLSPSFAGCFNDEGSGRRGDGYTHDAQCVMYDGPDTDYAGRSICVLSNETDIVIADITDPSAPQLISRATYPNVSYTHQGWLTDDHRYFFLDDELDERNGLTTGTRTLLWDVIDLDDPVLTREISGSTPASDHNQYVTGDLLFQSNYAAGVRVFDVTDPVEAEEIAFFDTFPANDNSGFNGTWSNYPFFPSRNVIVTGRGAGLFVIRPTELVFGVSTETPTPAAVSLSAPYPNPTAGMTRASFTLDAPASVRAIVYDVLGREVYQVLNTERPAGIVELEIDTAPLPSGVYFLRVTTSETSVTRAFVRR